MALSTKRLRKAALLVLSPWLLFLIPQIGLYLRCAYLL